MTIRRCIVLLAALLLAHGCSVESQDIVFEVTVVQWSNPDSPEVGATVILEEQRLQNGVLNAFYSEVGRGISDGLGPVTLSTVRSNVLSIRIRVEQDGCFDEWIEFNPEDLVANGLPFEVDVVVMPQCLVTSSVVHNGNVCPSGELIYRWIPRNVEGAASATRWTCETDWQDVQPGEAESESCWIAGDAWLVHQRYWSCIDSTNLDSIWCPRGGQIELILD